jgi:hypothetical protein
MIHVLFNVYHVSFKSSLNYTLKRIKKMNKQLYFDSYTNSLNYCFNNIDNYKVNKNDNFHNQITFTKKPSLHTTNILTLDIYINISRLQNI